MRDIGSALTQIMRDEQCSPVRAFFLLSENRGDKDGIHKLQPKSEKETSRGLRDKSNF